MSLIPGLGSLGPIGKLLDPGALVKDVVNGVLPKNMAVVGDLAGAVVDFKMGNPIGAVQHAMEAVKDLPQAAKGLQQGATANGTNSARTPFEMLDPSPPPLGSRAGKPFDMNELMSAIKALTAALTAHQTGTLNNVPKELREKMAAGSNAAASSTPAPTATTASNGNTTATPAAATTANAPAAAPTSTPATTTTASTDAHGPAASTVSEPRHHQLGSVILYQSDPQQAPTNGTSTWVGAPRTPAPANHTSSTAVASPSSAAAPAPVADSPASPSAPGAVSAGAAPASAPATGANTGQTITSVSQLQGMSDRAVRDAVLNGRIAPEVAKDQTAMMAIQQRMNAISEMNNLMTAMMRAVHDMQMAIIQNIRI